MVFIDDYQKKPNFSELEKQVLEFWDDNNTFKKSVEKNPESKAYQFYDGPPFATGLPHYGHILGSTVKDVVPRYWTMKGYRVERVWGWDCHGLPIENMIEKDLKLVGGKKGIEEYGIANFNEACRASVLTYDSEWRKVIRRIGRWVDMENSYKTMDNSYIESVWWVFKELFNKGLAYEGKHIILYCPRCATPLSNFEIAMDNSYQDVKEISVYPKFKIKNTQNEYIVAWTTTPWTLPGNVALAINKNADYVKIKLNNEILIVAKERRSVIEGGEIIEEIKGEKLVGLEYEPLYPYLNIGDKKAYYVTSADFVALTDGTGIVHTAAIYGEDDYKLALQIDLPLVPMLDDEGKFLDFVEIVKSKFFKSANPIIISDLTDRGLMLKTEEIVHSYPFCYRCESPLFYTALPAWFINVQKIKPKLIEENEKINWVPEHFKHGQFKKILESSPDWNVSRNRYWGSPIPVWECSSCHKKEIIGSVAEMIEKSLDKDKATELKDLHRPYIDEIKLSCQCGGEMLRIPEVFDCWVESASMPTAAIHYPFENKDKFEKSFPAQFISEYIGQVRAWFNVLHRISVALFDRPSFLNVVVNGNILGTDGKKMSKSKKNFPDPMNLIDTFGVDTLRMYLLSSPVNKGESVSFDEKEVKDIFNNTTNILWNTFSFYKMYSNPSILTPESDNILDKWLVSKTENLTKNVTESMDKYDLITSCRLIEDYITDLSTWYLRRSRERIKENKENGKVFGWAFLNLSKVMAPIMPFISEVIFKELTNQTSVHLEDWPTFNESKIDNILEENMSLLRQIVEKGHAQRSLNGIKVRQPLANIKVKFNKTIPVELLEIGKDELNVKNIEIIVMDGLREIEAELDTNITEELRIEGLARDFIRSIQEKRKGMGILIGDKVFVEFPKTQENTEIISNFGEYIKSVAGVTDFVEGQEFKVYLP